MSTAGEETGLEIAVVGMAGRFPGADGVEAFWRNLRAGTESITRFGRDEMERAGTDPALLDDPRWVAARGVLDGADRFDAAFFGYTPREAEVTDPQQRIFLECCWEALEHAGVDPAREPRPVGVFGGAGAPNYLIRALLHDPAALESVGPLAGRTGNGADFVTTRVSYKLGLQGPSVDLQTACSTSLVAVHLACQSLLAGESDLALAGGVTVLFPQVAGQLHVAGSVLSPDGRCRPFDARAAGTVTGGGAGVVVLKRLEDARADGDTIHAVILGSAINNDGAAKVGYTAPSVEGQARVVRAAQLRAGVDPATVSYVEAHGTGTELGDPVEVAALTQAFRARTDERGFCALGSVKGNVGHLDAAAGVAGLIKTVLALRARELPPTLHFHSPNPALGLAESPFHVVARLRPWEPRRGVRRAGVSSFGVGGTNAHVVLEEAPEPGPADPGREWQALVVSARTPEALDAAAERLAAHLRAHPEQPLADVAWTLAAGRREMEHRRAVVCRTHAEGAALLEAPAPAALPVDDAAPAVAFLFPGLGGHYAGMGRALYAAEPAYRAELDRCAEILRPLLGLDVRGLLHPAPGGEAAAGERLAETRVGQPAVFAVEYALAKLWASRGVRPAALLGHSLGEYAAACLAGVFSLEDALRLVARRAQLIQELPPGAMLSVPLSEAEALPLLPEGVCVAAVNAAGSCTVSGPEAGIAAVEEALRARGMEPRRLQLSHAFHSAMMDPVLEAFRAAVAAVDRRPPRIPLVSALTGRWITAEEATDPEYWVRHLRHPVRFAAGAATLLADPRRVFVECGPGAALATLVRRHPAAGEGRTVAATLRRATDAEAGHPDDAVLLRGAAALWCAGVPVEWGAWFAGERRRRVPLPTYPFQRQRYWIGPADGEPAELAARPGRSARDPGARHPRPALSEPPVAPRTEAEAAVAGVWEQLFGIAPVGVEDDFYALGGDSLLATQLMFRVRERLGVELPMRTLYQSPTPAGLARAAEAMRAGAAEGGGPAADPAPDLGVEAVLEDDVRPGRPAPAFAPPRRVLLTGATGFLGAYLLRELLDRTGADVYCLVRAEGPEHAAERLRRNLERYGLWDAVLAPRIVPVVGDLERPRLGLSDEQFAALAEAVDTIHHNGARVNFTLPYGVLRAANVQGTREVLRLACRGTAKRLHYVSTIAVFPPDAPPERWPLREDDPLDDWRSLHGGYARSKWVAERLVRQAGARGLPVTVFRPGVVGGHPQTGACNTDDLVWRLVKGCVQLGSVPVVEGTVDVTPVDYASAAQVALSLLPRSEGRVYHLVNPRPTPWSALFRAAEAFGYPLRRQPYEAWRQELLRVARHVEDNGLYPFLPLFSERPPERDDAAPPPPVQFDASDAVAALEGTGVRCTPVDETLLRVYLEFFVRSGFLHAPPSAHAPAAD